VNAAMERVDVEVGRETDLSRTILVERKVVITSSRSIRDLFVVRQTE